MDMPMLSLYTLARFSVLLLDYGLKPVVHLLLTAVLGADSAARLAAALVGLYNLLWLFPAYLISFLVNCIWCAKARVDAAQKGYQERDSRAVRTHAACSVALSDAGSSGGLPVPPCLGVLDRGRNYWHA